MKVNSIIKYYNRVLGIVADFGGHTEYDFDHREAKSSDSIEPADCAICFESIKYKDYNIKINLIIIKALYEELCMTKGN